MSFVHLHRHSEFSLLDGVGTAKHYADRCAEIGQDALAITDHGTMAGVLYHIEACKTAGIKPIVGMEAYFRPDIAGHREAGHQYGYSHLVLLAKDQEGFRSLLRLTSASYSKENYYQKPNIDWALLKEHNVGLIASSSCVSGFLPQMVKNGEDDSAIQGYLVMMQELFGEDFFLEIQPHDFDEQRQLNQYLVGLADRTGIPLVATVDTHYPFEDWRDTQDILLMISTNSSFGKRAKSDEEGKQDYLKFSGDTFWLMDESEVVGTFGSYHAGIGEDRIREAIANSQVFADRCEAYEISKAAKVPKITRSALEAERIVRGWIAEGLERIGKQEDPVYLERIERELAVMRKNKVLDYFVIVGKGVRWAKDQGIRVGPGRGSAAGSLVCYLSRITGIDPIGYDLLFERFMNEYRTELPDIDLDFQHDRRDEVKDFYRTTFGEDHVVDVAAFQTFGLKAAIQAPSRVFDIPYEEFMGVTKTIQEHPSSTATLEDLIKTTPEIQAFASRHPDVWKHALRLEGGMRSTSRHPAAVIVTDRPARDYIPLMRGSDGRMVTQWAERADFQVISSYGFLKIDVLSTDSLTAQDTVIKLIEKRHGVKYDYEDPKQFPVVSSPVHADPRVVEMFGKGPWTGIFQFSSGGITNLLKEINPDKFDDVIAANTLYRPGTMPVMEEFCDRKHGRKPTIIWHDDVRPFMERTYGLMIYQEQVMQVCQVLGGFDAGTSNLVLKALTKWHGSRGTKQKGAVKIAEYRSTFVEGCAKKGLSKKVADGIWDDILALTKYVFNRSHSAGYALQAYFDGWEKSNYLLEFYTSLLTHEDKKVKTTIREARNQGIQVLPPDVNASDAEFTLDGNSIRFGLQSIKGVGDRALEEILAKRPFQSLDDLQERVEKRRCNSRVVKALVDSGALDSLGCRPDLSTGEKGKLETQLLGFALSTRSDVEKHSKLLDEYALTAEIEAGLDEGDEVYAAGEVTRCREHIDKNGQAMAFLAIDRAGVEREVIVFADLYARSQHFLGEGAAILVKGKWKDGKVIGDHAVTAADLAAQLKGAA